MLCISEFHSLFPFCEMFLISEYLLSSDAESQGFKILVLWAQRLAAKKDY